MSKLPKTITCQICGKTFTKHDLGYKHWIECSKKMGDNKEVSDA